VASFSVKGPFKVPCTKFKVGRAITSEDIAKFWVTHPALAKERGCYLFGFRASKGSKPIYAGKATKSFKQEVFTDHKLKKYGLGFASQAKGTPILFFVCLNKTAGAVNKSAIDEAESYLIQAGLAANKNLLNDKKTKVESWSIGGIVRSKGKASASALSLRQCIKL
jgi:hypothetical protein